MAQRNHPWFRNLLSKRKSAEPVQSKTRFLRIEALEPRQVLSGISLSDLLTEITPNPHPSGDQPADTSQEIPLAYYSAGMLPPDPGIDPAITQFIQGLAQVYTDIQNNSAARPAYWGENVVGAANQVRLHLDDNGMLIRNWTIDWGDGSDPQTVTPQPWVVHQYPASGQYTILVTAASPDGTFSAAPTFQTTNLVGIGGSGNNGLQVTLADVPPTLHVADTQTVAQGQTFALDNLASFSFPDGADSTSFTYSIDWGDGTPPMNGSNVDVLAPGGTGSPFLGVLASDTPDGPLTHVYGNTGTYYLAVTVTADGSQLSDTQTIPINVVALTPTITGLPTDNTCDEGTTVTLGASVNSTLTDPPAYNWQILDSSGDTVAQSTDPTFSYTFTGPDMYTVSLVTIVDTVTSVPATATITVNNVAPSFVNPTIPAVNASVGQTFTLPPVAFTDPGLSDMHTATIDWGDGTVDDANVTEESSDGTTTTPGTITDSHAYASVPTGGYYTATITLMDDSGASVNETFNVSVLAADVKLNSFIATSGAQLQVSYTVSTATAAPFTIGIYTSADGTTPDSQLTSVTIDGSIGLPLTTGTHTATFTPAFDDTASDYHLIAVSDANSDPTQDTVEFAGGIFVAASVTQSPPQNVLYVFGSDNGSGDTVYIHGAADTPANKVVFDGGSPFSIGSTITGIHVRGEDGNDTFQADPDVTLPLWLYGGDGTNTLVGGNGGDTIVGGSGQNVIHDGNGWNSPEIVDNSDTQATFPNLDNFYHENVPSGDPGWSNGTTGLGFNGIERVHVPESGSAAAAVWTFENLDPTAYYDVYVTWSPLTSASTAAQYKIYDNTLLAGSPAAINQQQAPTGNQVAGVYWNSVGVYQAQSGTLIVQLGVDNTGEVLADAVRLVRHDAPVLTNLTMGSFVVDPDGDLSVSYTINGEDSAPFSIDIYQSDDGVQPTTLVGTIDVSDPANLVGSGTQHTLTYDDSLNGLDGGSYYLAQLDPYGQFSQTTTADNILTTPLTGVFQTPDGSIYVLTGLDSAGHSVSFSQDSTTGDLTVTLDSSATTFQDADVIYVVTYHGVNTIDATGVNLAMTIYGGDGSDTICGGDGGNTIYGGTAGGNVIQAGAGDDTIYGGGAVGSPGNTISGGVGCATIYAGGGADTITGGTGDDTIYAGAGNDTITGGYGNNEIYGGSGTGVLDGSNGKNNWIDGGTGDYTVYGSNLWDWPANGNPGSGNDWLTCGTGNDTVLGGTGNSVITGGSGTDELDGGIGTNVIQSGTGTNYLSSGGLYDILDGKLGTSTISSGIISGAERPGGDPRMGLWHQRLGLEWLPESRRSNHQPWNGGGSRQQWKRQGRRRDGDRLPLAVLRHQLQLAPGRGYVNPRSRVRMLEHRR